MRSLLFYSIWITIITFSLLNVPIAAAVKDHCLMVQGVRFCGGEYLTEAQIEIAVRALVELECQDCRTILFSPWNPGTFQGWRSHHTVKIFNVRDLSMDAFRCLVFHELTDDHRWSDGGVHSYESMIRGGCLQW